MKSTKTNKLIFELSTAQKESEFRNVLDQAMKRAYSKNRPLIYRNHLCVKKNQFIHYYKDGRTYLIEQDQNNSQERILKVLH